MKFVSSSEERSRSNSRENMIAAELEMKKRDVDEEIQYSEIELGEKELTGIDAEAAIPTTILPQKPRCYCFHPCCCCCFCVWMLGLSWKIKGSIIVVLVVFVVWAVLSLDMNTCVYTAIKIAPLPDPLQLLPYGKEPPTAASKQSHGFVLTLLGDSYLIDPEWNWHFHDKLHKFLEGYNFTIYNHGRRGERMKDVVVDMRKVFYNHSIAKGRERGWETRIPDGIIIMTGSDINSEIPWNFGSQAYYDHQKEYLVKFRYVLDTIISFGVPVAVASPATMLTEGPAFAPDSARFSGKAPAQADYCNVVKEVTQQYGIPYLDVHTAFQREIPLYRLCYKGCVTRDGEHPSSHGTDIMAQMFSQEVIKWFYTALTK